MCDCTVIIIYNYSYFQKDFDELVKNRGSKDMVFDWLMDNYAEDWGVVKSQLKEWGFESLATDKGMDFLTDQFSCSISQKIM